jgi:hypothetical protein
MSGLYVHKHNDFARYDIPAPLAREIGRFIVTWAHFENYVQTIIWGSLELSHAEGRIAVRENRITERLNILNEIGQLRKYDVDYVLLRQIKNKAEKLAGKRHLLAHSIWQKPSGYWVAVVTRGSWQETQTEIANYPLGSSKSAEPEAIPITTNDVRSWTEATIALIDDVEKLGDNPRPLPLPEKQKRRSVPRDRKADRKGSGRKPRHPTSQD